MDKPETVTAAKKAALKLNYANSNLPYFDKEVHIVPTEFKEDAPGIANTKAINADVEFLDSMDGIDSKRWTKEERKEYSERYEDLKKRDPERAKKYQNKIASKGATVEERDEATRTAISNAISQNKTELLPKGYAKKSFGGKPYLAKKDANGKWTKVQEWK